MSRVWRAEDGGAMIEEWVDRGVGTVCNAWREMRAEAQCDLEAKAKGKHGESGSRWRRAAG